MATGIVAAFVSVIVLSAGSWLRGEPATASELVTALTIGLGVAAAVRVLEGRVRVGRARTDPRRWVSEDIAAGSGHTLDVGSIRPDKFTDRAREVLTLAQDEAQRFNHNYIGTEHLLLGLVREGEGVAARVLENMNVELAKVRTAVEFIIGRGDRPVVGEVGLTPRAKRVIELAIDEARRLGHNYIGTEHLLLGLVREGEGIAAGVLESLGVNLDKVRHEVIRVLSATGSGNDRTESGSDPAAVRASSPTGATPAGSSAIVPGVQSPMADFDAFDRFVAQHAQAWLAEVADFARQPSVSATGEGIEPMGRRVLERLRGTGAAATLAELRVSHPAVIGEIGSGERSILFYDHYDVQPPGDPAAWSTPPFEPTLRDGHLFGRGVADDKGELLARIHAVEAWQSTRGPLPLRVRYLIEGAHEIGSPGLSEIVAANRERLVADACLSEGTGRDEAGNVTINLGCRGFVSVELRVRLRDRTLASMYGGLLPSAPLRLSEAVSTIVAPDGALLLDGADELVRTGGPDELALLERIPWDEDDIRRTLGIDAFAGGMSGLPLRRRYVLEPFVAVTSFTSGDPAWGLVIPGEATARLDIRLAPGLDPDVVVELLHAHLARRGLDDVTVTVLASVAPDRCSPDEPVVGVAIDAARDAEGRDPVVYPLMPAYSASRVFRDGLGTPVLFASAVTNASSNLHAANENIALDEYPAYVRFVGRFLARFATT